MALFTFGDKALDLAEPQVMGILNVTPDSFSDGGRYFRGEQVCVDAALRQAEKMVADGATLLDVGGESTRPGATPVTSAEELARVIPVIEALSRSVDVVISVDTSNPQVMSEAASAGAHLLNDVRAFTREGALAAAAKTGLPVCIMHMRGTPETMQSLAQYEDVVTEVGTYLLGRVAALAEAGIGSGQVILDPGFGFGKTVAHNLLLLKRLSALVDLGYPVLAGLSRKSIFSTVLGRSVDERLAGSLSAALLAAQAGARIVRVHDVRETVDALRFWRAVDTATLKN